MTGVTLSRWTMAYFAAALVALILGESLMASGLGFPTAPLGAPQTLVVVHLITIGWLSLLLCGALFQFVPVLIARPLHNGTLPLPALAFLIVGLCALLAGFLQLAGTLDVTPLLLPCAAVLLVGGFIIVLYDLGRTLWPARPLPLPARFVAVALSCLAVTFTLGAIFSFALAGLTGTDALAAIAAGGLPIHIVAGLGGWLTFAAAGVSYRLLAMFMLAPELAGGRTRAILWLGAGALAIVIVGGIVLLLENGSLYPALFAGAVLGIAALALYGADVVHLYRARKRRIIELNSQMAALALFSLAATAALAVVLFVLGRLGDEMAAVVFLAAFGWLSGLGLAKLYKIVAFLTWLECYGPLLGKAATPRVQDLVVEKRARKWFILYFVAVWCATAALLAAQVSVFRFAAGVMALSTLAIAAQLVRIRLLADVEAKAPLQGGVPRPHLLVSMPSPNR